MAVAREADTDALVCVGGGSAIGTAKIVARKLGPPILAVPTTYAGSEMTPIWGTTSDGHKKTGPDLWVLPRTVLYDPDLTRSPATMGRRTQRNDALAGAGTSIHHKVAHILGGTWNLPHAPLHAVLLPHTVAFAPSSVREAMAQAAATLGASDVPGELFALLGELRIDPALTGVGMPPDAFDAAVDAVVAADPTSPRAPTRDAVAAMLRGHVRRDPPRPAQ